MRILLFSNLYQLERYQKYSIRPYSELQSRKKKVENQLSIIMKTRNSEKKNQISCIMSVKVMGRSNLNNPNSSKGS